MKLKELNRTAAVCVVADTTIAKAADLMRETGFGFLPVVSDGLPIGVVTGHDIVSRVSARGFSLHSMPVSAVMSKPVVTIHEDTTLEDALESIRETHVRRVPVVNGKGLVTGVVSLGFLLETIEQSKFVRRQLATASKGTGSGTGFTAPGSFLG